MDGFLDFKASWIKMLGSWGTISSWGIPEVLWESQWARSSFSKPWSNEVTLQWTSSSLLHISKTKLTTPFHHLIWIQEVLTQVDMITWVAAWCHSHWFDKRLTNHAIVQWRIRAQCISSFLLSLAHRGYDTLIWFFSRRDPSFYFGDWTVSNNTHVFLDISVTFSNPIRPFSLSTE